MSCGYQIIYSKIGDPHYGQKKNEGRLNLGIWRERQHYRQATCSKSLWKGTEQDGTGTSYIEEMDWGSEEQICQCEGYRPVEGAGWGDCCCSCDGGKFKRKLSEFEYYDIVLHRLESSVSLEIIAKLRGFGFQKNNCKISLYGQNVLTFWQETRGVFSYYVLFQ